MSSSARLRVSLLVMMMLFSVATLSAAQHEEKGIGCRCKSRHSVAKPCGDDLIPCPGSEECYVAPAKAGADDILAWTRSPDYRTEIQRIVNNKVIKACYLCCMNFQMPEPKARPPNTLQTCSNDFDFPCETQPCPWSVDSAGNVENATSCASCEGISCRKGRLCSCGQCPQKCQKKCKKPGCGNSEKCVCGQCQIPTGLCGIVPQAAALAVGDSSQQLMMASADVADPCLRIKDGGTYINSCDITCRSYYSCWKGQGTLLECGAGFIYLIGKGWCEAPSVTNECKLFMPPSPPPVPPHPPKLPGPPPNPAGLGNVTAVISKSDFETKFFPMAYDPQDAYQCTGHGVMTYEALIEAAYQFPEFLSSSDPDTNKRELETNGGSTEPNGRYYLQGGLCSIIEGGSVADPTCPSNLVLCDIGSGLPTGQWPCTPGARYCGRGGIQLSWNYNYGAAGEYFGLDLLGHPEKVQQDGVLAWATSLWFWMKYERGTCHTAMTQPGQTISGRPTGFGLCTNLINGGILGCACEPARGALDCPNGTDLSNGEKTKVAYYLHYCEMLKVDPGANVYCYNDTRQIPFNKNWVYGVY
eukprot:gene10268-8189_t